MRQHLPFIENCWDTEPNPIYALFEQLIMLLLQSSVCTMCLAGKRVTAAERGAEGNGPQVAHWAHCATHSGGSTGR